jgi:quercetin dioxygenase-like cupin family protein
MNAIEIEKSKVHNTSLIVNYQKNSIVIKRILKKSAGNISVLSFDNGEGLNEKKIAFDSFIQVIDGKADIVIEGKSNLLETGQSIVIPAYASNYIKPNGKFKMIKTVIES